MRAMLVGLSFSCLFLMTSLSQAADREAALAVIEQAIKAHGGEGRLARTQQMTRTATGSLTTIGKETPFSEELTLGLPDRFRLTVELGAAGATKSRIIVVLTKDKGWNQTGGMTIEVSKERLEELRGDAYLLWLTTLTPLLKDESFTLTPQPDDKVGKTPASVIKVSRKGQTDVRLFFDKTSGLLIKTDRRAREGGSEFLQEIFHGEPKDFDGVKLATEIVELRSGQKFIQLKGLAYKFLNSVDDASFAKP